MQQSKQRLKANKQAIKKKHSGKKKHDGSETQSKMPGGNAFRPAPKYQDFTDDYSLSSQPTPKWFDSVPEDPDNFPKCSDDIISRLQQDAEKMMESETAAFNARTSKSSEKTWMRSVMAKGTGRDKVAAYTLMVQEEPLYNLHALRSLVGLVKPGKKENTSCIDTLVELFSSDLLRPNQKLKPFCTRPLAILDELSSGNPAGRRRRLIAWFFEDQLKSIYKEFITALQKVGTEAVEAYRERVIGAIAKLLQANPEQESLLLSSLVNKVGDPNKKVAAKAVYCLTQVVRAHPNMKEVIINEVEKLLFRPNIGQKARYYGICFLSQILFKRSDSQIAANLIKLYFSFFKACVKLGDVDSRMLSGLLTGVNRAYPYARESLDSISEQMETMYRVVHIAPFNISIHALSLLFQVADYKNDVSDRFYSVLYRKLLDPAVSISSHAAIFLNLVFRALKADKSICRVRAFIKRLLQVCCGLPVPTLCGALFTISQLIRMRPELKAIIMNPVKQETVKEETRSGKSEEKEEGLSSNSGATLPSAFLDDDSEDEHYEDVKLDQDEIAKLTKEHNRSEDLNTQEKTSGTWNHMQISDKAGYSRPVKTSDGYDPFQRNPLFANGDMCFYSELCKLAGHFHPTVALFASQLISGELVAYSGDPLQDFTLTKFLERFVFKNPKKQAEITSAPNALFAKRQQYSARGIKSLPVTSAAYLTQEEARIPVDERFLFKFLQRRRVVEDAKQAEEDGDESDVDSVTSDDFEDMLDKLMKKKGYKADAEDEVEEDLDFADEVSRNVSAKKKKTKKNVDDDVDLSDDDDDDDDNEEDDDDVDDDEDIEGDEDVDISENEEDEEMDRLASKNNVDDDDDDGMDEDFEGLDDDEEDMDFDDDDDDTFGQNQSLSKKGKKKGLGSNVFATAEEFSELLEAAGAARDGTSAALSNKDKASAKQINWEASRDRWVKGFNRFTKGGQGAKPNNKKLHGSRKVNFKKTKKGK